MGLFEHFPYTNFQDLNLDMLLTKMKELHAAMLELQQFVGGYEDRIKELETYIFNLDHGIYSEGFIDSLYQWLESHMPELITAMIKQVWFGLTDSGYFCAYIPDSWQEIMFATTGYDIELALQPEYGHLVLMTSETPAVIGG